MYAYGMKWYSFPRQSLQVTTALAVASTFIFQAPATAQTLPSIDADGWIGTFSGYKRRGFEFSMDNMGRCEIYLMNEKGKNRAGHTKTIKIYTEILMENEQGKISAKRLKEEGFTTEQKAGFDHKEVKYQAETTGDAKVEVIIKYDRDRIILDGRILDCGTLKTGKIYFSFKVHVPAMYSKTYDSADEKKIKSAMRRDRIKFTRKADKKRVSLKSYEEVELADDEMAKGGVTEIVAALGGQEGNDFIFTTVDGTGVLDFENKKAPLWKGYYVKWKRKFAEEAEGDKNKAKKGNSPLVIEFK